MALTNIRWAVAERMVTILRAHPSLRNVQIEPGFPGDTMGPEAIWIDEFDGDINIPVMTAGRKTRDDMFDVPFEFRVAGKVDLDETMERLSELVAALEDVLADDPGLAQFDGLISAEITSERMTCGEVKGIGQFGFAEVVVSCHARLD